VHARDYIDANFMHDDAPLMYSFNTGVGLFKDQRVMMADMAEYQMKTVFAHAAGIGEPFSQDVTRATMLLRANAFASNFSGPRVAVVDRLLDCLNAGLHPVIPQKGSVGASGDLAPLAHMSGAICGFPESEIVYEGRRMPAREALRKAGLEEDFPLAAKDASALINGSTVSLALGVLALEDARRILKHADIAMTLSLERRARGFRPPCACSAAARRTGCNGAQYIAYRRGLATLFGRGAHDDLSGRGPCARRSAAAARTRRLFTALYSTGTRPDARCTRLYRQGHQHRNQLGHRQPPDL
jgi:histidine ammonia-lyase